MNTNIPYDYNGLTTFIESHPNVIDVINKLLGLESEQLRGIIDKQEQFGLKESTVVVVLAQYGDLSLTKEYIEKHKNKLDKGNLLCLLETTKDPEYIKKFIDNKEQFNFDSTDLTRLISATKNATYIKGCVMRREEFGFSPKEIAQLIKETNDIQYIKYCIENSKTYSFLLDELCSLLESIEDPEYVEKQLVRIGNEYGESFKLKLEFLLGRENLFDNLSTKQDSRNTIFIPESMAIGIEIETLGEDEFANKMKEIKEFLGWRFKNEPSVVSRRNGFTGFEITSPKLTGNIQQTTSRIKSMCEFLCKIGNHVDETCGGHIHFESSYLDSAQAWINFIILYMHTERLLYIISNKEGEVPRKGIYNHAKPFAEILSSNLSSCIERIRALDSTNVQKAKDILANIQGNKNYGINFLHPETIEFRMPNGTIDSDVWIQNINLLGGIIRVAHDLATIQLKQASDITEPERNSLQCFENIINAGNMDETKTLENFLKLVFSQEFIELYMRRYNINSSLLNQNLNMASRFNNYWRHRRTLTIEDIKELIFGNQDMGFSKSYNDAYNAVCCGIKGKRSGRCIEYFE